VVSGIFNKVSLLTIITYLGGIRWEVIFLPFVEGNRLDRLSKEEYGKVRLWGSIGFIAVALLLGNTINNPYQTLYYLISISIFTTIFGILIASLII